jgi:hypothetical protein
MFQMIRPRVVTALVFVLVTYLAVSMEPPAHASGRRRQRVYAPGAYYYPAAAAAPVAAAPVFAGAISTTSAPTYYVPSAANYASAPVMVSAGTVATGSAPTMMTATITTTPVAAAPAVASAPTAANVYDYNAPSMPGTAAAPVGNAPGSAGLTQDQINSIVDELRDLRESLKDQGTTGSDRKNQLIEKARELVADEKGVSVDDLKASDRVLARRLVELATGGTNAGNGSPSPYPLPYPYPYPYPYGMAPQAAPPLQSFYLYPVALHPLMPGKHCSHHHFCHCGKYP